MTGDLRRLVGEIERSRIRLEAVLASLQDGVVITDEAGDVVRINSAAGRMLRVVPAEVVGQPFVVVSRDHELAELLRIALAKGSRTSGLIEFGLERLMLEAWSQAVVGTHETLGLVVLRDVTELRRLEAVRREFVANVSHELRTPLASIKAVVETLEAGAIDDRPMAVDFLARIVGEVDRLAALVDELLDLARLESGRTTLRLESLAPSDLIGRGRRDCSRRSNGPGWNSSSPCRKAYRPSGRTGPGSSRSCSI
jgi:two-component system phosphate regulon sensor histidine kinase PhoR